MPIRVACQSCKASYSVAEQHAGKRMKCKGCGGVVLIPASAAPQGTSPQDMPVLEAAQDDAMERLMAASAAVERAPALPSAGKAPKAVASGAKKSAKRSLSIGGARLDKRAVLLAVVGVGVLIALIAIFRTDRPLTLTGLIIAAAREQGRRRQEVDGQFLIGRMCRSLLPAFGITTSEVQCGHQR